MTLYSYVVAQDYGFAPNPFHGACTLATCKPRIREYAAVGDYIVGTGCAQRKRQGYLVYFMRVETITTFDEYWSSPRWACKRPDLRGSKMQAFGDNIYHTDLSTGEWLQENSYHSHPDGTPNPLNIDHDTKSQRVLIASDFAYWGREGPGIPKRFRHYQGVDICFGRGYRCNFPIQMVARFITWLRSHEQRGYLGRPLDWARTP